MNDQDERERAMLSEWSRDAIDAAARAGLLKLPYRPTDHVIGILAGYYGAGLSPEDAATALFGLRQ